MKLYLKVKKQRLLGLCLQSCKDIDYSQLLARDALSRPIQTLLPENVNQTRDEFTADYNRAGALESVQLNGTDYIDFIAYNAQAQRLLITYGNGIMTRYAYDNKTTRLSRLRSEAYLKTGNTYSPDSNLKQDYTYDYDLAGNIIGISDHRPNSGVGGTGTLDRVFKYDALYRLLSATGKEVETYTSQDPQAIQNYIQNETNTIGYREEYSFDKMGNILELTKTKTLPNTALRYKRVFNYIPNKNTLASLENGNQNILASFTHNANGAIETKNGDSYYWAIGNQLAGFYNGTDIREYYCYSGGTRVKKVHDDDGDLEVTVYIDGVFEHRYKVSGGVKTAEQNVIHIMDGQSRICRVRIGDRFAEDFSETVLYNLENHLGSSSLTLSNTKATLSREEYSPFGESTFGSYQKKRYRFVGKEKDASGLYYYGARYYMNWTCRFISVDPLAAEYEFYTPYQYAGNKPINNIDLDGAEPYSPQQLLGATKGKATFLKASPYVTQQVLAAKKEFEGKPKQQFAAIEKIIRYAADRNFVAKDPSRTLELQTKYNQTKGVSMMYQLPASEAGVHIIGTFISGERYLSGPDPYSNHIYGIQETNKGQNQGPDDWTADIDPNDLPRKYPVGDDFDQDDLFGEGGDNYVSEENTVSLPDFLRGLFSDGDSGDGPREGKPQVMSPEDIAFGYAGGIGESQFTVYNDFVLDPYGEKHSHSSEQANNLFSAMKNYGKVTSTDSDKLRGQTVIQFPGNGTQSNSVRVYNSAIGKNQQIQQSIPN